MINYFQKKEVMMKNKKTDEEIEARMKCLEEELRLIRERDKKRIEVELESLHKILSDKEMLRYLIRKMAREEKYIRNRYISWEIKKDNKHLISNMITVILNLKDLLYDKLFPEEENDD